MKYKATHLILTMAFLPGCAYLTTYNKAIDLEHGSVAIDAKQRVIQSRSKKISSTDSITIICAEPSPDALAVLGASGALSGSNASGAGGSASGGFAESAASIGLRTQSIQLLRDLNYRICEAYANDAIGPAEASALLRRGQSTMMGLIAIEQLTGPVVAGQVALSASVNAGTGGSSSDVAAAQAALTTAKENLLKAQAEVDTATTAHESNLKSVEVANAELSKAASAEKPDQSTLDSLGTSLKTAQDTAKTSGDTLKDKQRREKAAEDDVAFSKSQLSNAQNGKTATGAATNGQLGEVARANATSTQVLTSEVHGIVNEINDSYLRDSCFSLVTKVIDAPESLGVTINGAAATIADDKKDMRSKALVAALNVCTGLLDTQAKAYSTRSTAH